MADADAFRSIALDGREALWEVSATDRPVAMFTGQTATDGNNELVSLPVMTTAEHVVQDYATTSFSLKAHPVSFMRKTGAIKNFA